MWQHASYYRASAWRRLGGMLGNEEYCFRLKLIKHNINILFSSLRKLLELYQQFHTPRKHPCCIQNNQGRGGGIYYSGNHRKSKSSNNSITLNEKNGSYVFASSLRTSNSKRANPTWLPLEILHCRHTWPDYHMTWLPLSLTWLLYNLQRDDITGIDFVYLQYAFCKSENR